MKRLFLLSLFILLIAVSAATAQDVRYNFDQSSDFSKFKTYRWVSIKNAPQVDELTAKQITQTIDDELAKKGLTKTDADNADLYISYQTAIGKEKQLEVYNTGWGYGPGWGPGWYGYGGGMSTSTATTTTIYTGTLDLDMYDSTKKSLVWRGIATKTLSQTSNPEKRQKNLSKGVAKLLKNYPPKKK